MHDKALQVHDIARKDLATPGFSLDEQLSASKSGQDHDPLCLCLLISQVKTALGCELVDRSFLIEDTPYLRLYCLCNVESNWTDVVFSWAIG